MVLAVSLFWLCKVLPQTNTKMEKSRDKDLIDMGGIFLRQRCKKNKKRPDKFARSCFLLSAQMSVIGYHDEEGRLDAVFFEISAEEPVLV